eukprot:TRINITY_DN7305_c0_g4_i1.p1 TRINITY_DN7305_c0_g4~~TRINITY_DN7305_c0_g4_i1.p1  ORF type:complete len:600 (-),score=99.32 TRINITY_DN7305_c0_g4_i1:631-2430(-)
MLRLKQLPRHVSSKSRPTYAFTTIPDTTTYKRKGLHSVEKYNPHLYLDRGEVSTKTKRHESPFYDYCIRVKSPFQTIYRNKILQHQTISVDETPDLPDKDAKFLQQKAQTNYITQHHATDRSTYSLAQYTKTAAELPKMDFRTATLPRLGKEKSRVKWKKLAKCTLFNFEIDGNNAVSLVRTRLPDAEDDVREKVKVKMRQEGRSLSSQIQKKRGIEDRPRRTSIKVYYGVGEESSYRTLDSLEARVQGECKKILLKNKIKDNLRMGLKLKKLLEQGPSETVFDLNTLNISKIDPANHLYIYLAIKKAVFPTFYSTGAEELNIIDPEILEANKLELTDYDKDLIALYKSYMKQAGEGKVVAGFWQVRKAYGYRPICRESPSLVVVGSEIYVFGGYGVDRLNDLWRLSVEEHGNKYSWSNVVPLSSRNPEKRYGHNMAVYNNDLYIFGGSSDFLTGLKMRIVLGDLWRYSPGRNRWTEIDTSGHNYKNRMYAASCALHGLWAIHGGIDGDHKNVLTSIIGYHFGNSYIEDREREVHRAGDRQEGEGGRQDRAAGDAQRSSSGAGVAHQEVVQHRLLARLPQVDLLLQRPPHRTSSHYLGC